MKITFSEVESILNTLPTGYYTSRRIPVNLDDKAVTSYYLPVEDKIVIGFPIIKHGFDKISDTEVSTVFSKESAVRSMLYHEISHAIMTPDNLSRFGYIADHDVMNIFEDERIEYILKDYYLDVDFTTQKYLINNMMPNEIPGAPKTALEAFYDVVRFRYGKKNYVDRVQKIINKYEAINKLSSSLGDIYGYMSDVKQLYNDIELDFLKNPDDYRSSDSEKSSSSNSESNSNSETSSNSNSESSSKWEKISDKLGEEKCCDSSSHLQNGDETYVCVECDDGDDYAKEAGRGKIKDIFDQVINRTYDSKIIESVNNIFRNFTSRIKNNNSATQGYSGVFNPRNAIRNIYNKDYKFFDRKCTNVSAKGFSKFHLNLFIDCSGSYANNVDNTNKLLQSLRYVEKSNPMFTFNLIECGDGQQICPDDRKINRAYSGTYLTDSIFPMFRKLQQSDSVVYNIVLYDGCAGYGSGCRGGVNKNFTAFNHSNVTLIYEKQNKVSVESYCPKAKKIYVSGDFSENLIDNVISTLKIALN